MQFKRFQILKHSPLGRYIFEKLIRADQMINELNWILSRARAVKSKASKRTVRWRDDLRRMFVDVVFHHTGHYYDDDVSTLVAGAEGKEGKNTALPRIGNGDIDSRKTSLFPVKQ